MLQETGLVTKVDQGIAWVNTRSKLSCSSCQVESSCGNALVEKYLSGKMFISQLPNSLNAQVGDEVVLGVAKQSVTRASIMVYFLPLFGLIAGALLGQYLLSNEILAIILAALGFCLTLPLVQSFARKCAGNADYTPKMLRIVKNSAQNLQFTLSDNIKIKNLS